MGSLLEQVCTSGVSPESAGGSGADWNCGELAAAGFAFGSTFKIGEAV